MLRDGLPAELYGKSFPVFNGQGFVMLVDSMGSDHSVAAAARLTAQSKGVSGDVTKDDTGLLRYLMRHRHTTPIEFAELQFKVRVPMDTWRQWIRHRTANVNEYSTRYSEAIDETATTPCDKWRMQSASNRQGSSGTFLDKETGRRLSEEEAEYHRLGRKIYENRIQLGVAKELARKDLPLSTFTEAMWKCDLHNLFHFLGLRMEKHAQIEIRECAGVIGHEIVSKMFPILWQAFLDYELNAVRLTAVDVATIKAAMLIVATIKAEMLIGKPLFDVDTIRKAIPVAWNTGKPHRERDECIMKLRDLDLINWEPSKLIS